MLESRAKKLLDELDAWDKREDENPSMGSMAYSSYTSDMWQKVLRTSRASGALREAVNLLAKGNDRQKDRARLFLMKYTVSATTVGAINSGF